MQNHFLRELIQYFNQERVKIILGAISVDL